MRAAGLFVLGCAGYFARQQQHKLWRWLGARVAPHVPPRYGVTISNNILHADQQGPPIEVGDNTLTVRGDLWDRRLPDQDRGG